MAQLKTNALADVGPRLQPGLANLPDDLLHTIFAHLDNSDLRQLRLTAKWLGNPASQCVRALRPTRLEGLQLQRYPGLEALDLTSVESADFQGSWTSAVYSQLLGWRGGSAVQV